MRGVWGGGGLSESRHYPNFRLYIEIVQKILCDDEEKSAVFEKL